MFTASFIGRMGAMVDWNHDGKVDAVDYAITSSMLDDDNEEKPTGCCGPAVAMILISIMLPVITTIVFKSH